jgi:hypothetical protein
MADTFSDIAKNASSMSVTELGSSLLGRKEATQKAQNKRDRKDARIAQVLGVLTAGQGLFKNAFNRRQKELANVKTLDLLNNEADAKEIANISSIINVIPKDFTKAIDPTTGLPYTVEQNTDRFFSDHALQLKLLQINCHLSLINKLNFLLTLIWQLIILVNIKWLKKEQLKKYFKI